MIDLKRVTSLNLIGYGQFLYETMIADSHILMESRAQTLAERLHADFETDGQPLFSLLRIFRFGPREDLSTELQAMALSEDRYWLALMGTYGEEPDWRDRRKSAAHQVIPADSYATPMLRAAFQQLGLSFGEDIQSEVFRLNGVRDSVLGRSFYIDQAAGSVYVPDQEFVSRYNIQSVLGIGAPLENSTACLLIGFTSIPLSGDEAATFGLLTPYLMTLLAATNQPGQLWAEPG